jgi:hypothetical protein
MLTQAASKKFSGATKDNFTKKCVKDATERVQTASY